MVRQAVPEFIERQGPLAEEHGKEKIGEAIFKHAKIAVPQSIFRAGRQSLPLHGSFHG